VWYTAGNNVSITQGFVQVQQFKVAPETRHLAVEGCEKFRKSFVYGASTNHYDRQTLEYAQARSKIVSHPF
jgi:hypothetical protein